MSLPIAPIHTPCKKCVFAVYEDKTQTDCHLNYINKYKDKNIEILEAYDEEKEFYIVNGKKCLGYRENSWFEKRNLTDLSIQEKIEKFKSKNYIHYLMIINLNDLEDNYQEILIETLKNLTIKPQKIIFIRYQNSDKKLPYEDLTSILDIAEIKTQWRIQTILDQTKSYLQILHETLNINKKYRFILSINHVSKDMNVENIISAGNKTVYEDMDQFIVLSNTDKSVLLFSASNYRYSLFVEHKDILTDVSCHVTI